MPTCRTSQHAHATSELRPGAGGRGRTALRHAWIVATLLACSGVRAALPEPLPPFAGASITPVLDDARIHGVPTRIRQFEAEASAATVRAFYRAALEGTPVASRIDGWEVLSWTHSTALRTVRLRPCPSSPISCTEGTLSESDLSPAAAPSSALPWLPRGSLLSTDIEMNDPGRHARILVWHDESSPSWAAARLVRELSVRGLALERRVPVSRSGLDGIGLWFGAHGREAVATIVARGGATTVTLHMVELIAQGRP